MNHSGSCRRISKFCFGLFPTNLFLLLLSGTTSAWLHQELHHGASGLLGQNWSFVISFRTRGRRVWLWAITICLCCSDSVLQVDWCSCACVNVENKVYSRSEDKSQCALQAVPTWKRVSVTSRESPFPGEVSSSWGYNKRQNLRLLGTSFGCSFFIKCLKGSMWMRARGVL